MQATPGVPAAKAPAGAKARANKTPLQKEVLEASYNMNSNPSEEHRRALGDRIGLTEQQVQVWFTNRRRKDKKAEDPPAPASALRVVAPAAPATLPAAPSAPVAAAGAMKPLHIPPQLTAQPPSQPLQLPLQPVAPILPQPAPTLQLQLPQSVQQQQQQLLAGGPAHPFLKAPEFGAVPSSQQQQQQPMVVQVARTPPLIAAHSNQPVSGAAVIARQGVGQPAGSPHLQPGATLIVPGSLPAPTVHTGPQPGHAAAAAALPYMQQQMQQAAAQAALRQPVSAQLGSRPHPAVQQQQQLQQQQLPLDQLHEYAELLAEARRSLGVEYRVDGPPLAYIFDDPPVSMHSPEEAGGGVKRKFGEFADGSGVYAETQDAARRRSAQGGGQYGLGMGQGMSPGSLGGLPGVRAGEIRERPEGVTDETWAAMQRLQAEERAAARRREEEYRALREVDRSASAAKKMEGGSKRDQERLRKELQRAHEQAERQRKREEEERAKDTERNERERRKAMERMEKEKAREDARRQKELERLKLLQEKEAKKMELAREKEAKAAEKKKLMMDSKRKGEKLGGERVGGGRSRGTAVPLVEDLDLEWDLLIAAQRAAAGYPQLPSAAAQVAAQTAAEVAAIAAGSDADAAAAAAAASAAAAAEAEAARPTLPPPVRPPFPPLSLALAPAFPPEVGDVMGGELAMVVGFLKTVGDLPGLQNITLDDLIAALWLGTASALLSDLHVALLRLLQADMEEAYATGAVGQQGATSNFMDRSIVNSAMHLEEAWAWGYDVDIWRAHLNTLTWPEVLRQFAVVAGAGLKRPRTLMSTKAKFGVEGEDVVADDTGALRLRLPPRFAAGTVKAAAWQVLAEAGPAGMNVADICREIQKQGLRDLRGSKTPEASIGGALSRDALFCRISPATYALQAVISSSVPITLEGIAAPAATAAASTGPSTPAPGGGQVKAEGGHHDDDDEDDSNAASEDEEREGGGRDSEHGILAQDQAWVTTLTTAEYDALSVRERLDALLLLVYGVLEGPTVRALLDARLEEGVQMRRGVWEEAKAERRQRQADAANKARIAGDEAAAQIREIQAKYDTTAGPVLGPDGQPMDPAAAQQASLEAVAAVRAKASAAAATEVDEEAEKAKEEWRVQLLRKIDEEHITRLDPLGYDRRHNSYWRLAHTPPIILPPLPTAPKPQNLKAPAAQSSSAVVQQPAAAASGSPAAAATPAATGLAAASTATAADPAGPSAGSDPGLGRIYVQNAETGGWSVISTPEQLAGLKQALDARGLREAELLDALQEVEAQVVKAMPAGAISTPLEPSQLSSVQHAGVQSSLVARLSAFLLQAQSPNAGEVGDEIISNVLPEVAGTVADSDPRLTRLKLDLLRVERGVPVECVDEEHDRAAWTSAVQQASTPEQLRACLATLEAVVSPEWLAVGFPRTPAFVKGAWLPGPHENPVPSAALAAATAAALAGAHATVSPAPAVPQVTDTAQAGVKQDPDSAIKAEPGSTVKEDPDTVMVDVSTSSPTAAATTQMPKSEQADQVDVNMPPAAAVATQITAPPPLEPLAWLPATVASLALRLQAFDAAIMYRGSDCGREHLAGYRYTLRPASQHAPFASSHSPAPSASPGDHQRGSGVQSSSALANGNDGSDNRISSSTALVVTGHARGCKAVAASAAAAAAYAPLVGYARVLIGRGLTRKLNRYFPPLPLQLMSVVPRDLELPQLAQIKAAVASVAAHGPIVHTHIGRFAGMPPPRPGGGRGPSHKAGAGRGGARGPSHKAGAGGRVGPGSRQRVAASAKQRARKSQIARELEKEEAEDRRGHGPDLSDEDFGDEGYGYVPGARPYRAARPAAAHQASDAGGYTTAPYHHPGAAYSGGAGSLMQSGEGEGTEQDDGDDVTGAEDLLGGADPDGQEEEGTEDDAE